MLLTICLYVLYLSYKRKFETNKTKAVYNTKEKKIMAEKKVTEKKAEAKTEKKAVKTVVDFDSTQAAIQSLIDTGVADKLSHKDAFRLVTPEMKTICYFHIRKYTIDVYVPEEMNTILPKKNREKCSSRGYGKILVADGKELFESLTIVYNTYMDAQKKKAAEAEKAKAAKKKPAKKEPAA